MTWPLAFPEVDNLRDQCGSSSDFCVLGLEVTNLHSAVLSGSQDQPRVVKRACRFLTDHLEAGRHSHVRMICFCLQPLRFGSTPLSSGAMPLLCPILSYSLNSLALMFTRLER